MRTLWQHCHVATMADGRYSAIEDAAIVTSAGLIGFLGQCRLGGGKHRVHRRRWRSISPRARISGAIPSRTRAGIGRSRRATKARLDDVGAREAGLNERRYGLARQRGDARRVHETTERELVHADRGSKNAGAHKRHSHQGEQPLDRAVLAAAAMQRDEGALEAVSLQFPQIALGRVEGVRIHALRAQCRKHRAARHDGNLAFGGTSAEQHGDLAERLWSGCAHVRS